MVTFLQSTWRSQSGFVCLFASQERAKKKKKSRERQSPTTAKKQTITMFGRGFMDDDDAQATLGLGFTPRFGGLSGYDLEDDAVDANVVGSLPPHRCARCSDDTRARTCICTEESTHSHVYVSVAVCACVSVSVPTALCRGPCLLMGVGQNQSSYSAYGESDVIIEDPVFSKRRFAFKCVHMRVCVVCVVCLCLFIWVCLAFWVCCSS